MIEFERRLRFSMAIGISSGFLLLILIALGCTKPERLLKISTLAPVDSLISYKEASLKGEITDLGNESIGEFGIMISKSSLFLQPEAIKVNSAASKGVFEVKFQNLDPGVEYYFRSYAKLASSPEPVYAIDDKSFTTKTTKVPAVSIGDPTEPSLSSIKISGNITDEGGETVTKRGLCWGTSLNPTIANAPDTTVNGSGKGVFTGKMKGLNPGTDYHVRAYAINIKGTGYSEDKVATTLQLSNAVTGSATSLTVSSATLNGTVNANNSSSVVTFEWGTTTSYGQIATATQSPVTGNNATSVSAGITGLTQGTTYHYHVKSVSAAGTSNGNDMTFTSPEPPTAVTAAATGMTGTTATLNGTVNAKNSSTTVTFEYGLTTSYGSTVTATQSPVTGNTAASVSAAITGLSQGTTYHFRVKASSAGGIANGDDQTFITPQPPVTVTTEESNVTSSGATLNGTVNANNSSTVVTFEYGTTTGYGSTATASQSPVTGNSVTNVSAIITGLNPSTTYHYRVKGTSSGGTSNGNDQSFTTPVPPPTVTDYDGNVYNTVQIGTQTWMKENLKVTHYSNGDLMPNITDGDVFMIQTSGAMGWYANDAATYKNIYGGLYNYIAVNDIRNICPTGWHSSSDVEWQTLIDFLGGSLVAGGKLKEVGNTHWTDPNTGATNSSGLTLLPGGDRMTIHGSYSAMGYIAYVWTSSRGSNGGSENAEFCDVVTQEEEVHQVVTGVIQMGMSARCIKGEIPLSETDSATAIASTSVTLNGKVNPNGATTNVSFEYGTTTSYGSEVAADQSPATGSVPVVVSKNLTGLTPGASYHYRVKAVNTGGTSYGSDMTFSTTGVIDLDGNIYNTVKIGTQIWMKENLKTTRFNDNTLIPLVADNATWAGLLTPGYCYFNNDETTFRNDYGALYNWYAINSGKICPIGWRVPTDNDWIALETLLGGSFYAVTKLKEAGTTHWLIAGGNNESGFTALPGGYRFETGGFNGLYGDAYWWSSVEFDSGNAWSRRLNRDFTRNEQAFKVDGFSVRCIKN